MPCCSTARRTAATVVRPGRAALTVVATAARAKARRVAAIDMTPGVPTASLRAVHAHGLPRAARRARERQRRTLHGDYEEDEECGA